MLIVQDNHFVKFLRKLKDALAKANIADRIDRIRDEEDFGDHRHVDSDVFELRIFIGPGYRVYFTKRVSAERKKAKQPEFDVVILLCAGSKKTQEGDIKAAVKLSKQYEWT